MSTCKRLPMLALMLCLPPAGCQSQSRARSIDTGGREMVAPDGMVAQSRTPISDVPIPEGFKWDSANSRSVEAPGLRLVEHRYVGRAQKWQLGQFFQRQMPLTGWRADSSRMSQGDLMLYFSKPSERCEIIISDGSWGKLIAEVIIYPIRSGSMSSRD